MFMSVLIERGYFFCLGISGLVLGVFIFQADFTAFVCGGGGGAWAVGSSLLGI